MEVWKTIEDFTNYEVSNFGNVRRKKCEIIYCNGMVTNYKEKLLKPDFIKKMYKRVTLSKNNIQKRCFIHRLVAKYFLENIENKPCVNHKDGNGSNNNVSNLEWCTYSENEKHSYNTLGKINPIRKLTELEVVDIRQNCVKGNRKNIVLFPGNVKSFAIKYKVDKCTILNVLNNKYYV